MSVILQPYQQIPFSTSLDFQTSRIGGSLCTYENLIDENNFVPFAILSPDGTVGNIELYDCDDNWLQSLSLTITSEQNIETGLWFHYYNGDDFGLSCGTYYMTILIGDLIWYSEQFTIREIVNNSQYPELIKDDFHLPLRIYDSITKQLANKKDIGCDIQLLNPVSYIIPFMFETDEDINDIDVFLVDTCSGEEIDLSADMEIEFIKASIGTPVDEEVLTTSQQLRSEYYEFDSRNFVFQEIKINDTGILKNITFEWLFNHNDQTITIDLILGTNPSGTPISTKIISDHAVAEKELTIDYTADNITVTSGEIYILKFSTEIFPDFDYERPNCTAGISVNSTKVYPDGRFAERNYIETFKDFISTQLTGTVLGFGDTLCANFTGVTGDNCYGLAINDSINPALFEFQYKAYMQQVLKINAINFSCDVVADEFTPARVLFKIDYLDDTGLYNSVYELYRFDQTYTTNESIVFPNLELFIDVINHYKISVTFWIQSSETWNQTINLGSIINIYVFNYGSVSGGIFDSNPFVPVGTNYQNKSLWFYCNITKTVYVGGSGATKIYNPGRPLPSPLICGNYYLKLVSTLHTWYSEWLRVINVGQIDLTTYVLGTEDGEIIITEDSEIIETE